MTTKTIDLHPPLLLLSPESNKTKRKRNQIRQRRKKLKQICPFPSKSDGTLCCKIVCLCCIINQPNLVMYFLIDSILFIWILATLAYFLKNPFILSLISTREFNERKKNKKKKRNCFGRIEFDFALLLYFTLKEKTNKMLDSFSPYPSN